MNIKTAPTSPCAPSAAVFHRYGYHVWRGFLDTSEREEMLEAARRLLTRPDVLNTPESDRLFQLYRFGEPFAGLLTDRRLQELTDELLGSHATLSDLSLNQVIPHGKPDRWHIDYPYNDMQYLVEGGLLGLQCILPLTPFDAQTGATEFIAGSHAYYRRPPLTTGRKPEEYTAEPGDLIILAASTWHRAGVNQTDSPRIAVLLSFIESWVRPMHTAPDNGPWAASTEARIRLGLERA